jgi:hypothetical protein
MDDSLGFAIIGCGVISRTHAEVIASIEGAHLAVEPHPRGGDCLHRRGASGCGVQPYT